MKRSRNEPYINKAIKLGGKSTFFSLNPVSYDKLEEILTSADIGIVNYKVQTGAAAWENLAKASGKIADYLSCGIPVLCSNFEGAEGIINKYKCGEIFYNYEELPACIDRILQKYQHYKSNALQCFDQEYKFSKYFLPVLHSMESLNN
jgi:glycosyltransferase involved in cell wall biosynthesis